MDQDSQHQRFLELLVESDREMEGAIDLGSSIIPILTYAGDVKFEEEADGFGSVIGINFSPSDKLNFGLHYDTKIDLDYNKTRTRGNRKVAFRATELGLKWSNSLQDLYMRLEKV